MKPSERFVAWLDKKLRDSKPGDRLPTDSEIVRSFDLSIRTLGRILKAYKDKGRLLRIQGKGTFIPGGGEPLRMEKPSGLPRLPARTSSQSLADGILAAIGKGEWKRGDVLPTIKFTSLQFQVTPATVIHAYRILRDKGVIVKIGKRFWVGDLAALLKHGARKEVYFFSSGYADFQSLFIHDEMALVYRKMELELQAHHYYLNYRPLSNLDGLMAEWVKLQKAPAGLVFPDMRTDRYPDLISKLKRLRNKLGSHAPHFLMDGDYFNKVPPWLHLVCRGNLNTAKNRTIARYLFDTKAEGAVFYFDEYRRAPDKIMEGVKIQAEIKALDPGFRFLFVIRSHGKSGPDFFARVFERVPPARVTALIDKYRPEGLNSWMRDAVFAADLKKAWHSFKGIKTWLCSSDHNAASLFKIADAEGKRIPAGFSIIGMENNPKFYGQGISGCVPDWDGIGYLMAHALIGDIELQTTGKGFLKVSAVMLHKATTRWI